MSRYDRKSVFIGLRLVVLLIGLIKTIIVVRILTLQDYAVIGVVESLIALTDTLLSFEIVNGITREVSADRDSKQVFILVVSAFGCLSLVTCVAGLLLGGVGLVAHHFYGDPRLQQLLFIGILIYVGDTVLAFSLAVLRAKGFYGTYIVAQSTQTVIVAMLTILLTMSAGVHGYFAARALVSTAMAAAFLFFVWTRLDRYPFETIRQGFTAAVARLWGLSKFLYIMKLAGTASLRLPLVIGARFLSTEIVGIASVAHELARKILLINESLTPLLVPRMAQRFKSDRAYFIRSAMSECYQVAGLNVILCAAMAIGWSSLGWLLIGQTRWIAVDHVFYLFLLAMFCLSISWIFDVCLLIPACLLETVLVPTVSLRLLVIPMSFLAIHLPIDPRYCIPLSMLIPAALVTIVYIQRSRAAVVKLKTHTTREAGQKGWPRERSSCAES